MIDLATDFLILFAAVVCAVWVLKWIVLGLAILIFRQL